MINAIVAIPIFIGICVAYEVATRAWNWLRWGRWEP